MEAKTQFAPYLYDAPDTFFSTPDMSNFSMDSGNYDTLRREIKSMA